MLPSSRLPVLPPVPQQPIQNNQAARQTARPSTRRAGTDQPPRTQEKANLPRSSATEVFAQVDADDSGDTQNGSGNTQLYSHDDSSGLGMGDGIKIRRLGLRTTEEAQVTPRQVEGAFGEVGGDLDASHFFKNSTGTHLRNKATLAPQDLDNFLKENPFKQNLQKNNPVPSIQQDSGTRVKHEGDFGNLDNDVGELFTNSYAPGKTASHFRDTLSIVGDTLHDGGDLNELADLEAELDAQLATMAFKYKEAETAFNSVKQRNAPPVRSKANIRQSEVGKFAPVTTTDKAKIIEQVVISKKDFSEAAFSNEFKALAQFHSGNDKGFELLVKEMVAKIVKIDGSPTLIYKKQLICDALKETAFVLVLKGKPSYAKLLLQEYNKRGLNRPVGEAPGATIGSDNGDLILLPALKVISDKEAYFHETLLSKKSLANSKNDVRDVFAQAAHDDKRPMAQLMNAIIRDDNAKIATLTQSMKQGLMSKNPYASGAIEYYAERGMRNQATHQAVLATYAAYYGK